MDTGTAAKVKARQATNDVKPWIRGFARMGYIAKGMVYVVIGVLAAQAALGPGGKTTDSKGAFTTIASKPFGEALLWLLALGLIGYASWKIIQAFKDPDNKGSGMGALGSRIGYFSSAIIHLFLAYNAVSIIMRAGSSSSSSKQSWSAKLLGQPYGQWVLGFVGLCFIAFGIYQAVRAYKKSFMKHLKQHEMHNQEEWWGKRVGQFGFTARGVVFGLIGVFIIQTAITADPDKTKGFDGALSELAKQSYGAILLGIVAFGLIAYGIFMFVIAKNRRMNIS
ncbi:DUF1206 domain-containing protein [Guptibacillus hwajinpoensis]|uniref:Large-conductance mechanosensitive channel n=1 Tax=Guptibacillus hwajinpoensis TaxID=208199 RepID=A0ABU0K5Z0_9BACL|nr:DUF1206 domain-containing protein [Alkalihalobacillus hemicentroti]MDQ0483537.1 large-conductance mechanosensitive channel [Alkalihalobacillus hemicentroti]